jgi:lipopolysaccharide export system ATP-binding protein
MTEVSPPIKPCQGRLLAQNLVKSFGARTVVDDISFYVDRGEIVGLLGPNGAGKSTSFKMVAGLLPVDHGHIFINEQSLTGVPLYQRARQGLGYLPQEPCIFRNMTVYDNLMTVLEMHEKDAKIRKERAEKLLNTFRLSHVRDAQGASLSGGERRRCEIARALVPRPTHLLFDEPFAGVDPIAVKDIQEVVQFLVEEEKIGVLITDHAVRETLSICKRATLMDQGKILVEGTPEVIAADENARRIYLGADFRLEKTS